MTVCWVLLYGNTQRATLANVPLTMHPHECRIRYIPYMYTASSYIQCTCSMADAVVGLERTIFTVTENMGVVELCARVFEPDIECPIEFPFDVVLSTADRTAGMY